MQVGDEPVDLLALVLQIGNAALTRSSALIAEARRHGENLAGGEPGRDQVANASGTPEIGLGVPAVAIGGAGRDQEAGRLVMAQGSFADTEVLCGFVNLHCASLPSRFCQVDASVNVKRQSSPCRTQVSSRRWPVIWPFSTVRCSATGLPRDFPLARMVPDPGPSETASVPPTRIVTTEARILGHGVFRQLLESGPTSGDGRPQAVPPSEGPSGEQSVNPVGGYGDESFGVRTNRVAENSRSAVTARYKHLVVLRR